MKIEGEISTLRVFKHREVSVAYNLHLTMIVGKIHSMISETSAAVCDLCKARASQMNDLDELKKLQVNEDFYKYGLSSLHASNRSMECLLHTSYKLEVITWQARSEEAKNIGDRQVEKCIRPSSLRNWTLVRCGTTRSGNTNTGNWARRFFENPIKTAEKPV